jgi:hypothetical protein
MPSVIDWLVFTLTTMIFISHPFRSGARILDAVVCRSGCESAALATAAALTRLRA